MNLIEHLTGVYPTATPAAPPNGGHAIRPHVGAAFLPDGPAALRIMAIGVNSYFTDPASPAPERWSRGFIDQDWPFQRRVLRDIDAMAEGLHGSQLARGLPYLRFDSVYLTNAVKRWLRDAKKARAVEDDWLEEGAAVLARELALLAAVGRLPTSCWSSEAGSGPTSGRGSIRPRRPGPSPIARWGRDIVSSTI